MRPVLCLGVVLLALTAVLPLDAQQQTAAKTVARAAAARTVKGAPGRATPSILPGTKAGVFTTIQGNALSSTNGQLVNGIVRLRDARVGRIVDIQTTDQSGLFAFRAVDPGSYIVELVGPDSNVLTASQILNVNAGDAVSAVLKLPFRIPPFAGLVGQTSTPSAAAAVTSAASASGVLATAVTGEPASAR